MQYLDFDILISRSPGNDCEIRAGSESHGEDQGILTLDILAQDFIKDIERLENRQTDRHFLQQFGERLYQAIFTPEIDRLFQRSYGAVERDEQLGLRLRLHIEPQDISALPWELLYSSADKDFLCTRVVTPIVRYLRMNKVKRDLATEFPLRVLVVIPQGSDETANLNVSAERDVLARAMAGLESALRSPTCTNASKTAASPGTGSPSVSTKRPITACISSAMACFAMIEAISSWMGRTADTTRLKTPVLRNCLPTALR
jgi:hypothetical protein